MWFRGYEMLGEKKYLQAGLDFVDAILRTQREDGMFPSIAELRRGSKSSVQPQRYGELQDEYNFVQFSLVCYAYKLTRDQKYLGAALKHAEAMRSCQDPARDANWQGPWPHTWHNAAKPLKATGGAYALNHCYMFNDYATWDGIRTMVMAYELSGDRKYIARLNQLPTYIFKAQRGLGNVRGWPDMTDAWGESTWQRNFEGPLIDPRNFNRFISPMLAYFSAVTNNGTGLNMIRESYDWLRSMERPGGWAYKYTYDGREAATGAWRDILTPAYHFRDKVQLESVETVLNAVQNGGVSALRNWRGSRPVVYNADQYLSARLEAAQRVTDEDLIVRLCPMTELGPVTGKFLERVRQRGLQAPDLDRGRYVWRWWRPLPEPTNHGWEIWQYVWDVRVALGKIDANTAAWGGRGLESGGAPTLYYPEWDAIGDWSTKAVEVENWLDIPLEASFTPVQSVRLEPATMILKVGEVMEIKLVFTPALATCQTGTWTVVTPEIGVKPHPWVQPQMLREVDPAVLRPTYPREGRIMVNAGMPHKFPNKYTIVFTSTDGKHKATCEVEVTN
jgi:hypothetical protein